METVQDYEKQIPRKYRPKYRRAMQGHARTDAVQVKCLECCQWIRREVYECSAVTCPLYPYRPESKRAMQDSDNRNPVDSAGSQQSVEKQDFVTLRATKDDFEDHSSVSRSNGTMEQCEASEQQDNRVPSSIESHISNARTHAAYFHFNTTQSCDKSSAAQATPPNLSSFSEQTHERERGTFQHQGGI